jgi:hypothetical protein
MNKNENRDGCHQKSTRISRLAYGDQLEALSSVAESEGLTSKADVKVLIERMAETQPIENSQNVLQKKS